VIIFRTDPSSLKTKKIHTRILLLFVSLFLLKFSFGQGRVVINEYMPWTLNGCGATAEFAELMNFGPGPINIGCYILTDGDYSVTIPPNTILKPGEFYVIAGQDSIPFPCANIDSAIHADLNWNSCGCTSSSIPTTGDGFFTDGGFANEQVVLLDPTLKLLMQSYGICLLKLLLILRHQILADAAVKLLTLTQCLSTTKYWVCQQDVEIVLRGSWMAIAVG
jgi:hypothetical protein